ncbi:UDP-3-O-(3-hydroxymyristoyl)glucosamine N-acyltransferase [Ferribacterium limneticum]|uniref:UDP-3-O-(3-hydroxymyristoyl)glucosamine N-acyltransferase n=1 Tax=Ferribacterium limneticum TaxID=76259 RepID=UPI001CFBB48B|nr:UDP-3-O-(3-hydroxymyristoyl)glucosamine N-acyltransferase [Ferribacterium limneticum]UCV17661.1 UDP-3-O-(3-hydroxymyristoyl)glucosamine N-acyltransferase [Ferribacterium limneticum]
MAGLGETTYTLADIAAQLGGDVLGDPQTRVSRVAPLVSAAEGEITFLANPKFRSQLATSKASAVILRPDAADEFVGARIVTGNPYAYYARVTALLNPQSVGFIGIHASAVLESAVPASVVIGPNVVIGRGVTLGENVAIHAGCVIGDGVSIGDGSVLYPNVVVYYGCRIGYGCILHSGAVIGADGFGFAPDGQSWVKIPQIGGVVVGNDVEIGANTTVDRGALEDTVVGDGCKIDNLVHVGHNCRIGANSVLAGCTGVAGSTVFGEHCIVGGAGMISGHLNIVGDTTISGGSTVMKSIMKPGVYTSVQPLDTHEDWLRNASHIRRLAKLADRVAELEKKLK